MDEELVEEQEHLGADSSGGPFLLVLVSPFTRRDVIRAFRWCAHELHPHGGHASRFRKLVAERKRALSMLCNLKYAISGAATAYAIKSAVSR